MSEPIIVRTLGRRGLTLAARTLSDVFRDDPLARLICPDAALRPAAVRAVMAHNVRCARALGGVLAAPGCAGVALWLPGDPGPEARVPDPARAFARLPADILRRLADMGRALDGARLRAAGGPHIYLPALGVREESRNKGIATALLGAAVRSAGVLPLMLEALTRENREFYEKRGFEAVAEIPLEGARCCLLRRPGLKSVVF